MRKAVMLVVAMLTFTTFTSWGPAAQAASKDPFLISWGEMWSGVPIPVPSGTQLLFDFGWGFASESEGATDPADYLDQLLDGGYELMILVDDQPLAYTTNVEEVPDVCGIARNRKELCQDATFVIWEYLSHPLASGSHSVYFRLELLKDYRDDGWGWSYRAGDTLETSNTIVVGR